MRNYWLSLMVLTALLVVLVACGTTPMSPIAIPLATTAVVAPQVPTSSPAISPEEAAWAKIVEAAQKEGKLTLYGTSMPEGMAAWGKAFESRYRIDLEWISGRGAEYTERLKTERRIGQRVGDVTNGSGVLINNMKLEGLLTSVADELPALRERGVWWVEPTAFDPQDKANLALRLTERTVYINTKLVKSEEIPKSWKDLLGTRWTGNMAVSNPNIAPGLYDVIVALLKNKVWDEDYIRALYRQKLRMPANDPDVLRLLATGEVQMALATSDAFAATFAMEGAPIQAISIEDVIVVSVPTVAALAGAPHPNAARVFMNWVFSAEGQTVVGKSLGNKMLRKDVPDFRPKTVQAPATRYFMVNLEQSEKATELFRQKWFDQLVGR